MRKQMDKGGRGVPRPHTGPGHSIVGATMTSMHCMACSHLLYNSQHSLWLEWRYSRVWWPVTVYTENRQTLLPVWESHNTPISPIKLKSDLPYVKLNGGWQELSVLQALWPINSGLAHWATGTGNSQNHYHHVKLHQNFASSFQITDNFRQSCKWQSQILGNVNVNVDL